MKPQDVVILLKLMVVGGEDWRQVDIANDLLLSQGEVAKSLARLKKSGLVTGKRVNSSGVLEFLSYGLKYVFPAELGPIAVGVPTAMSAPSFKTKLLQGEDDKYIWPSSHGKVRGQLIKPFYPGLAEAVLKDKVLYELMASVEVIRVGRAREKKIAIDKIRKRAKV